MRRSGVRIPLPPHLAWQIPATDSPFHQPQIYEIKDLPYCRGYYCSPRFFLITCCTDDDKIEFCFPIAHGIDVARQAGESTNSFPWHGFSSRSDEQTVQYWRQRTTAGC